MKPLGKKAYGSIPHLPGSRLGPAEHHIHPGQAKIATEKVRDYHDRVIVQEKLDGSCVSVAIINHEAIPLTRSGYLAISSPYKQHHYFHVWAKENRHRFMVLLREGERAVGEWLVQAAGTRYNLKHEPFVLFDIFDKHNRRLTVQELLYRNVENNAIFITPMIMNDHCQPMSIYDAMRHLERENFHGAIDKIEGAVWRVERSGIFDFICKYVRPDKEDGKYFPEKNEGQEVWNYDISRLQNVII